MNDKPILSPNSPSVKLTPAQRKALIDFAQSDHANGKFAGCALTTARALINKGLLELNSDRYCVITDAGRDVISALNSATVRDNQREAWHKAHPPVSAALGRPADRAAETPTTTATCPLCGNPDAPRIGTAINGDSLYQCAQCTCRFLGVQGHDYQPEPSAQPTDALSADEREVVEFVRRGFESIPQHLTDQLLAIIDRLSGKAAQS